MRPAYACPSRRIFLNCRKPTLLTAVGIFALKLLLTMLIALALAAMLPQTTLANPLLSSDGRKLENDFNGDGFDDLVTLESQGASAYMTLKVYLTASSPEQRLSLINDRLITAFASVAGTGTRLHLAKSGDLIIVAFNEAIGRERWNFQTKFVFANGTFFLGQLVYRSRDNLDSDDHYECRLDFRAKTGTINGTKLKIDGFLGKMTLAELSTDILGPPFELCNHLAGRTLNPRLDAFKKFWAFIPEIERTNNGTIIDDVRILTGDLNGDDVDDAVVSFSMTREDEQLTSGAREAAVYVNRKNSMQVVGALPRLKCGWHVSGITDGGIVARFSGCRDTDRPQKERTFLLCPNRRGNGFSLKEDRCAKK